MADNTEREKAENTKSPLIKQAIYYVEDMLKRLKNNECSDEEIGYILGRVNAENKGYFNEKSFVNYDEAMRELGIKKRETLLTILARHGVKMKEVKKRKMGFLRTQVEAVATLEQRPHVKRKQRNKNN